MWAEPAVYQLASSAGWQILNTNGIEPAPDRSDVTRSQFLHSQAAVACVSLTNAPGIYNQSAQIDVFGPVAIPRR